MAVWSSDGRNRIAVKASASLTVGAVDGESFARDIRSEVPFAIRQAGGRFLVVGTAAAPVGGDQLSLSIDIEDGARADVGTVASTVLWPGPKHQGSKQSLTTTTIRVGAGGFLRWRPEPTVSVLGSDHVARTRIELAEDATCEIVEEYSLGRSGEPSGRLLTELRVVRAGRVLVHHAEQFGPSEPGSGSLVGVASARHVLAAVYVGRCACQSQVEVVEPASEAGWVMAWFPIAADGVVVLGAGPDRPSVLEQFATTPGDLHV